MLPLYPIQQYVGEKEFEVIDIRVYYINGERVCTYYEDAHDGYGYENNQFRLATFKVKGSDDLYELNQDITGDYISPIKAYHLQFIGFPSRLNTLIVDGKKEELSNNWITVSSDFQKIEMK